MSDPGYTLTDTSADTGFTAWGQTMEALFVHAYEAIRHLLFADHAFPHPEKVTRQTLSIHAPSTEVLLVDFLNMILSRIYAESIQPDKLHILSLSPTAIQFQLTFSPWICPPGIEIKGITHHRLQIERGQSGYIVNILIDI